MAKSGSLVVKIVGDTAPFEDSLSRLQGPVLIGAAAAGAAAIKGFSDAMAMEDLDATLESQLGIPPERAAELGDIAGGLYRDAWGDSLEQVGSAVAAVEQSLGENLGAGTLEGISEQALAFADTFNTDVEGAIASAQNLITSGLAADAQEAFDLLASGFQEMPPALRDELTAASDEYGRFFDQLGISGNEAFGLLTSQAEGGVFGIDKTGDALKELSIRATDMSSASVEAFEAAGLNAGDMANAFLAGGDEARGALDDLIGGLLSIEDPVEQSNAAIALFGTPLEDLGTGQIPDFLESLTALEGGMGDVEGAAQDVADTMGGTTSNKIESFKRQAFGALADFGENVLIPAFEGIVSVSQDLADWFSRNTPALIGALTGIGVVIAAVVVPALYSMAAGVIAATWPFLAIAAAIAALVAGVVYAYEEWDWFRETVDAVASFFKDTVWPILQDVFNWLKDNVPPIIDAVVAALTVVWEFVRDNVIPIFQSLADFFTDTVVPAFQDVWGFINDYIIPILLEIVETVVGVAQDVGEKIAEIIGFFTELKDKVLEAIGDALSWLLDVGKDIMQGLWDGIEFVWNWIIAPFLDIGGKVLDIIGDLSRLLYDIGKGIIQGLWDGMKSTWESVAGWLGGLGGLVGDLKGPIEKDRVLLVDEGEAIMDGLGVGMRKGWRNVESFLGGLTDHAISGSVNVNGAAGGGVGGGPLRINVAPGIYSGDEVVALLREVQNRNGYLPGIVAEKSVALT